MKLKGSWNFWQSIKLVLHFDNLTPFKVFTGNLTYLAKKKADIESQDLVAGSSLVKLDAPAMTF